MGKLVKLVIVVAIVAVAAYVIMSFSADSGSGPAADRPANEDSLRVEEKYGFTTETIAP
jgi:hypothetical protein